MKYRVDLQVSVDVDANDEVHAGDVAIKQLGNPIATILNVYIEDRKRYFQKGLFDD